MITLWYNDYVKKKQSDVQRVALYARVSTKDGQETENQLIALRDYCRKQGWRIAGEYVDRASGGTSRRPEFMRLFEHARLRKFDLVLFWSLDRFSREGVLETLNHLQRLTTFGVNWMSLQEQYLSSIGPFADAVLAILACIARQERIRRSERAQAAIERLRRQGKTDHLGRPALVVDREKASELWRRGRTVRQIAAELGISPSSAHRIVRGVRR
jgi:DNA invertase Pin-like site-specific DNA recombinase